MIDRINQMISSSGNTVRILDPLEPSRIRINYGIDILTLKITSHDLRGTCCSITIITITGMHRVGR